MREARVPGDARAQERSRPADGAAGRTELPGGPGHPPTGPSHPKERSGPPTARAPEGADRAPPRRPEPGYPTEKCTARPRNGMVIQGPGWAIIARSAIATPSTP